MIELELIRIPEKYIDCHCHLGDNVFYKKIDNHIEEWKNSKINQIGTMATNYKTSLRNIELKRKFPEMIIAGIGRHPWGAHKFEEEEEKLFDALISKQHFDVFGEIGLDYYFVKETEKYSKQKYVFDYFLKIATKLKKPIMIHQTGAEKDIVDILSTYRKRSNVCCHWYSGESKFLRKLIDLDCYFSINPAFVNSKRHLLVLKNVNINRLLPETDSPVKFQGETSTPLIVKNLYEKIAKELLIDQKELSRLFLTNFQNYLST